MKINYSMVKKLIRETIILESKTQQVKDIQKILGVEVDGEWGPLTDEAWYEWCKKEKTQGKAWDYFSKNAKDVKPSDEKTVRDGVKTGNVKKISNIFRKVHPKAKGLEMVYNFIKAVNNSNERVDFDSFPKAKITDPGSKKTSEKTSDQILYLGDSQMEGALGNALIEEFGSKLTRIAKHSKQAQWLISDKREETITALKQKPSTIIISLNGNGIEGTEGLLDLIKKYTPKSNLIWTGCPPLVKMYKEENGKITPMRRGKIFDFKTYRNNSGEKILSWASYVQNPKTWADNMFQRNEKNKKVEGIINKYKSENNSLNWHFFNPFNYLKDANELTPGSKKESTSSDGIHFSQKDAKKYVDLIKGDVRKIISSKTIAENKLIKISRKDIRRLLSGVVNL